MKTFLNAVAVVAACCVTAARADGNQSDQMKGIGMPILFIFVLTIAVVMSRKHLMEGVQAARGDTNVAFAFISALVTSFMSIFLYFSAAYGYGLVATVLAYCNALLASSNRSKDLVKPMIGVMIIWFCFLVGIPSGFSAGIIVQASDTECKAFYPSYSDTMCKDGWIVFLLICCCVMIGLTLMSLLSLLNLALSGDATYVSLGDGQMSSPLRQNEYNPPAPEYQKVME